MKDEVIPNVTVDFYIYARICRSARRAYAFRVA